MSGLTTVVGAKAELHVMIQRAQPVPNQMQV
jgi:hypothetical protein